MGLTLALKEGNTRTSFDKKKKWGSALADQHWLRPGEFIQGSLRLGEETFGGWAKENENHKVHDYHDHCLELAWPFFPLQVSLGSCTVLSTDNLERGASRGMGSPFSF